MSLNVIIIIIVRCVRREETVEYWCGLYKLIGRGWYATRWYDGNPSTYRDWALGYRNNRRAKCVLFTPYGWDDQLCDTEHYYVCKAAAGKLASACCNHRHGIYKHQGQGRSQDFGQSPWWGVRGGKAPLKLKGF